MGMSSYPPLATAAAATAAFRGAWSASQSYTSGDTVVFQNQLWQLTGAQAAGASTVADTLTTSQTLDPSLTLVGSGTRAASGITFSGESSIWRDYSTPTGLDFSVDMLVTGTLDGNNLAGMFIGGPANASFPTRRQLMLLIWWSSATAVNVNWYDASGAGTSLVSAATTAAVTTKRRIRVTVDASRSLAVLVDGTQVATATVPAAITAGKHGIADTGSRATWSNFSSTTTSSTSPSPATQLTTASSGPDFLAGNTTINTGSIATGGTSGPIVVSNIAKNAKRLNFWIGAVMITKSKADNYASHGPNVSYLDNAYSATGGGVTMNNNFSLARLEYDATNGTLTFAFYTNNSSATPATFAMYWIAEP